MPYDKNGKFYRPRKKGAKKGVYKPRKKAVKKTHPYNTKGTMLSKFKSTTGRKYNQLLGNKFCKMFYHQTFVITPGTTGFGYNIIYCNDLYNPTDVVADHQPYGFDEQCVLYAGWRVHYATIRIKVMNQGDLSFPVVLGAMLDLDGTIPNLLDTKIERTGGANIRYLTTSKDSKVRDIYITLDIAKFKNTNIDNTALQGTPTSSPSGTVPLVIWAQTADQSTSATNNVIVNCEVMYYTEFISPKDIAGS